CAVRGAVKRNLGETVLDDLEPGPGIAHATAEIGHLRHGQTLVARHHDRAAGREDLVERLNHLSLFSSIHRFSPFERADREKPRAAISITPPAPTKDASDSSNPVPRR